MTGPRTRLAVVLILCAASAGCTSPEARRTRGGGPGADPRNRPEAVKMHGGSDPFWRTPQRVGNAHPPLDSARQARQISRR